MNVFKPFEIELENKSIMWIIKNVAVEITQSNMEIRDQTGDMINPMPSKQKQKLESTKQ